MAFRIGILGAGHIARKMAWTVNMMPDAELAAVGSRNLDRAVEFAREFGIPRAWGSYQELVEDPDVDLVYVATPHSFHHAHVRLCLESGKPVLCEKAFMLDAAQAHDVISLSREKGVFLAEAIWTRYMPLQRQVCDLIARGEIGTPAMLSANLCYPVAHKERIIRPELGGGALLDLGVYTLNFALMMFGDNIKNMSYSCVKADTGVDLQNCIVLEYEDGRMADLRSSALCAGDRQGIVCGDGGYVVCDNINNMLVAQVFDTQHNLVRTLNAPEQISGFEYQVRSCIRSIRQGRLDPPEMPHSEILRVMELMDGLRSQAGA